MRRKIKHLTVFEFFMVKIVKLVENFRRQKNVQYKFNELFKDKDSILQQSTGENYIYAEDLGINEKINNSYEIDGDTQIIGKIDQDGYILSSIGPINGLPIINEIEFMDRERFEILLVVHQGRLGIKKNYKSNVVSFTNELNALYKLGKINLNVPRVLDVDFNNMTITISYIYGNVIRESLAELGARIRDSQVGKSTDYSFFKRRRISEWRIYEGKRLLRNVVDDNFTNELVDVVNDIHSLGFIVNDIKYGNIIIDKNNKTPYIIDFESSWEFTDCENWKYRLLRKYENMIIDKHFNLNFKQSLVTRLQKYI